MREMISLPGIGGSGETHWQSAWEHAEPGWRRFAPASWDEPVLADWIESLEREVLACRRAPVLVAHSLSCLAVSFWAERSNTRIAGAFMVAAPDPEGPDFPAAASSFRAAPTRPLPFPSLLIASSNDPYGTLQYARERAGYCQSGFLVAGALGHINASSGLAEWTQGRALLEAFCAGLCPPRQPVLPASRSRA